MLAILAATLAVPLAPFEGRWRCEGRFITSGKPISSELKMATDPQSGVFIVHHDDTAPMAYHSVEVWTADPNALSFHSAVNDRFSGLRVFQAPELRDGMLTFSRSDGGVPKEEFRYALKGTGLLQVDWSIARAGQPLRLGDTLTCKREGA